MAPHSRTLAWKIHGRRSLVGCSPWGRKESDTTERLHFHFSFSCIREGTGNPLQCSCLENPRDAEPGGLLSMGSNRVRHHGSDLAAAAAAYIHIYTYVCVYRKIERYAISLTVEIRIQHDLLCCVSVTLISSFLPHQYQPGRNLQSGDSSHLEKEKDKHANSFRK